LRIKLELKSLLRRLDKEVSNSLRNGVSDVSDSNLEVSIDSGSDFLHKEVCALTQIILRRGSLLDLLRLDLLRLILLTGLVLRLLLLLFLLRNDISSIGKIFSIVCEVIVLLSIDD